jgi:hypothetical protein
MDTSVVMLAFLGAVGLFAAFLVVLLRADRSHRDEHARRILDAEHSRRRATMAARTESAVPTETVVTIETMPIVRPGSFCRVPGTVGRSRRGTLLVCSSVPEARPRWREARRLSRAS